jgi:hypothetical protein
MNTVTITNPTPISSLEFSRMWITGASLVSRGGKTVLSAELAPYDGTHLLATGTIHVAKQNIEKEASMTSVLPALTEKIRALATAAGIAPTSKQEIVQIVAPDPARLVTATVLFRKAQGVLEKPLTIPDVFGMAAVDPDFGTVVGQMMEAIAGFAGLRATVTAVLSAQPEQPAQASA